MTTVRQLHDSAMEDVDRALAAKRKGDEEAALRYFGYALELEEQAARLVDCVPENEPTRSILYRSAASLANMCGKREDVYRLVAEGLAGWPPREIKEELVELLRRVQEAVKESEAR